MGFKTKDVLGNIWIVNGDDNHKDVFVKLREDLTPFLQQERYFLSILPDYGVCILDDKQAKKPITPIKLRKFLESSFGRAGYADMANRLDGLQELKCSKEDQPVSAPIVMTGSLDPTMTAILQKYVCFTASSGGDSLIYVRTSMEYKTWGITNNALLSLISFGLYSELEKDIDKARRSGKTSWSTNTDEEGRTILEDIYHKLFVDGTLDNIVQDERFHKTQIVDFSNDIDIDTLCYFPYDSDKRVGHCQHWLNFESQMPELYRPVWRSLFAGIFDDKNRSRQIAILFDKGQTGKSNTIRAINTVAGPTFMAPLSKDSLVNQFWGSKIYGRRLVVFSDSGNSKITQMDKIKQLSGGDPIDVERKGKEAFSWTPNCRVIVTTNRAPELDIYKRHQTSRMVLIPLEQTKDPAVLKTFCKLDSDGNLELDENGEHIVIGADYGAWMIEEFWDYLSLCRESYDLLCPNRMETILPTRMVEDMLKNAASEESDTYNYILSYFLVPDPNGTVTNSDVRVILDHIGANSKTSMDINSFREFARAEGVQPARIREGLAIQRGFKGLALRSNVVIKNGDVRFLDNTDKTPDLKINEDEIIE